MENQMTFPVKSDLLLNSNKSDDFNLYLIYYFWVPCSFRGGTQFTHCINQGRRYHFFKASLKSKKSPPNQTIKSQDFPPTFQG